MRQPWWKREAVIAWALLLVAPVGLVLMWKYASWRNRFKWGWTAVLVFVWTIGIAAAVTPASNDNAASAEAPQATRTSKPTNTPRPSATPKPTNTPKGLDKTAHAEGTADAKTTVAASTQTALATPGLSPAQVAYVRSVATASANGTASAIAALPSDTPTVPPLAQFLPGVNADDLVNTLEKIGMTCDGPGGVGSGDLSWDCKRTLSGVDYDVMFEGPRRTQLASILASVFDVLAPNNDADAARFLSYIAAFHYGDADSARATAWVSDNVANSGAQLTIGSAVFIIAGKAGGRELDIFAVGQGQ